MSELKATPGPWEAGGKKSHGTSVYGPKTVSVAWVGCASTHGDLGHYAIDSDEAHANAHLIAAAPDLYAELKAAEKILEDVLVSPWRGVMPFEPEASKMRADLEQIGRVRAALAKARGEGQS